MAVPLPGARRTVASSRPRLEVAVEHPAISGWMVAQQAGIALEVQRLAEAVGVQHEERAVRTRDRRTPGYLRASWPSGAVVRDHAAGPSPSSTIAPAMLPTPANGSTARLRSMSRHGDRGAPRCRGARRGSR